MKKIQQPLQNYRSFRDRNTAYMNLATHFAATSNLSFSLEVTHSLTRENTPLLFHPQNDSSGIAVKNIRPFFSADKKHPNISQKKWKGKKPNIGSFLASI